MRIDYQNGELRRESLVSTFLRLFILGWLFYFALYFLTEHFSVDLNLDFLLHDNFQNGDFDTFRDFFEVNLAAAEGDCYLTGNCANYPPLALALGKLFALFTPTPPEGLGIHYQAWAVRDTNAGAILFIVVFGLFTAAVFYLLFRYLKQHLPEARTDRGLAITLSVMLLFSYSFVFAIERGNYVLVALIAFIVFVFTYRDHEVLSAVALAICACIKVYPVVLFVLYLIDKRYKGLLIGICTGLVGLLLPMAVLDGSFADKFMGFLGGVLNFNNNSQATKGEVAFNFIEQHSNSFSNIFRTIAVLLFGMSPVTGAAGTVVNVLSVLSTVCLILLVIVSVLTLCFTRENWKRFFILYSLLCLIPSNTYDYMLTFFLPILVMVLCGGKAEDRKYVVLLTALSCFPKCYYFFEPLVLDASIQCGLNPLLMTIMLVLLAKESLTPVVTGLIRKKNAPANELADTAQDVEPVPAQV